jgi:hypothetical protein
MTMVHLRRLASAGVLSGTLCIGLSAAVATTGAQKADGKDAPDAKRPQIKLKANPVISVSPAKVTLTAEIVGGANDFEEYYCPTVEWEWGDGTKSESSADCAPYEAGKSEIKRRFTVEHVFRRADNYRVAFRLKRRDKAVGFATVQVQVRPGLPEGH